MSDSVVDWSQKPEPWRSVGLRFRAECEGVALSPTRRQTTGECLRARRLAMGLSLDQIAKEVGWTSRGTASKVETDSYPGMAERYAAALDRIEARQKASA